MTEPLTNLRAESTEAQLLIVAMDRAVARARLADAEDRVSDLTLWANRLADVLFLTLVDGENNGPHAAATLADFRDYLREEASRV